MKPWVFALIGFVAAGAAFAADMMLLTIPAVRNGYWTFLVLIPAFCVCLYAVSKQRSFGTIAPTVLAFLVVGFYSFTRFMTTPAAPPAINVNQDFPSFELKDQDGKDVSLRQLRSDGPVIVVLFRGHW